MYTRVTSGYPVPNDSTILLEVVQWGIRVGQWASHTDSALGQQRIVVDSDRGIISKSLLAG